MRSTALLALSVSAALSPACSSGNKRDDARPATAPVGADAPAAARKATITIGSPTGALTLQAEVVKSEAAVERGLMYRQHLPIDEGMLFLMGQARDHTFWMHNTLIPLDMIFIRQDLTIAGVVENATPRTDDVRHVGQPSFYVLEVNGGWCAAHGVKAEAKVTFAGIDDAAQ